MMSENWPWNAQKITNLLWIINTWVLFPENGRKILNWTIYCNHTKKQDEFNSTTDIFTSFDLIDYKEPPRSFSFVVFRCPSEERWVLSNRVTDSHQQSRRYGPRSLAGLRGQRLLPERLRDDTCSEVREDAVGGAARPHLLALMEPSQPICPICLRGRKHFMFLSTQVTSPFTRSCVIIISCHVFLRSSKAAGAEIRRTG